MTIAEKIERARRRRESRLFFDLLALSDEGQRDTVAAIRHGFSVNTVLQNTFTRAIPVIAGAMADTHEDAFRRFGKITDVEVLPLDAAAIARMYEPQAVDAARAMAQSIQDAVNKVAEDQPNLSVKDLVRTAFDEAGYTRRNATGLDLGVERSVVTASNIGMIDAGVRHSGDGQEFGIYHESVVDNVTTDICLDRNTLLLRASHPYWTSGQGVPQLHWRCRSLLLAVAPPYVESDWLPTVPAMPGFGSGPLPVFTRFSQAG